MGDGGYRIKNFYNVYTIFRYTIESVAELKQTILLQEILKTKKNQSNSN